MISVICCYKNVEQFEAMRSSLSKQDIVFEVIGLDNRDSRFSSAAAALNAGVSTKADYLVFLHQDILFENENSLRRLVEAVRFLKGGIVGIAGTSHKKKEELGAGLLSAETLDECCVAMPRELWEQYRFDEAFCNGWHLYVVELCLRLSGKVQIAYGDFGIKHLSIGNVDEAYMKKFRELLKRYKEKKWIYNMQEVTNESHCVQCLLFSLENKKELVW